VAQPERPAPRSGSNSKARRARLRSSRSRLHVRSLRRSLRASAPRPLAAPGRDVRDRPDLLGGRPGINSGPHSPRAVVPRSNVWSLRPDAGFDSPRASLNGDAPVEPLGDGQSPSSEGVPPSGGSGSVPRRFFGSMTVPARKSCKDWQMCRQLDYDFTEFSRAHRNRHRIVDPAESLIFPACWEALLSNCRAS